MTARARTTAAAKPPPRQRRDGDAARAAILEAAAAVFSRVGYHGTTIDQVAAQAGYSPAALYKHFTGRDAILGALWNEMAGRLETLFDQALEQPAPFAQRLRWLLEQLAALIQRTPEHLVAFLAQRPYVSRARRTGVEKLAFQHYQRHVGQLAALMETGTREGALRDMDPQDAALLFIGLVYEFAYRWATSARQVDLGASVDRVHDLFLRGAGRAPREAP